MTKEEDGALEVMDCLLHIVDELTDGKGPVGYSGSLLNHDVRHKFIKEALDLVSQQAPCCRVCRPVCMTCKENGWSGCTMCREFCESCGGEGKSSGCILCHDTGWGAFKTKGMMEAQEREDAAFVEPNR